MYLENVSLCKSKFWFPLLLSNSDLSSCEFMLFFMTGHLGAPDNQFGDWSVLKLLHHLQRKQYCNVLSAFLYLYWKLKVGLGVELHWKPMQGQSFFQLPLLPEIYLIRKTLSMWLAQKEICFSLVSAIKADDLSYQMPLHNSDKWNPCFRQLLSHFIIGQNK